MKWFYNFKTQTKLFISFGLIAMMLAAIGTYSVSNLQMSNGDLNQLYNSNLSSIESLSQAQIYYQRMRVNIRDVDMAVTSESKEKNKEEATGLAVDAEMILKKYSERSDLTEEETGIIQEIMSIWPEYKNQSEHAMQLAIDDRSEDLREFMKSGSEMNTMGDQIFTGLKGLIDVNKQLASSALNQANSSFQTSSAVTIGVIILGFILSIILGIFISRIISKPLNEVVELVKKVAAGDLREKTEITTKDEMGQLAKAMNDMVDNLRTLISNALNSAQNVAAASQQISASTEEIATGSTDQANSAQTMNELFKELTFAIESVAASAEEASELGTQTVHIAREGGHVVKESIKGMTIVNEQMTLLESDSNKIGDIIEVIDDIAEQTNLLALNAAIEAARAGEQGRGFAVVADEVRKLAERSGEATKQITGIIKGMQSNTGQSVKSVMQAVEKTSQISETFDNIVKMISDSSQKVDEIAAASEQQSAQSKDVLQSIESISAASEEAAAASEETASTSQSLAELAEGLNESVSVFKVS